LPYYAIYLLFRQFSGRQFSQIWVNFEHQHFAQVIDQRFGVLDQVVSFIGDLVDMGDGFPAFFVGQKINQFPDGADIYDAQNILDFFKSDVFVFH